MVLSERIQAIADHYNMSLSEVAEKVGLLRATLHTYVKGVRGRPPAKLPVDLVPQILKAFPDISLSWLVLGQGEMISDMKFAKANVVDRKELEKNIDFKEKYYEASDKIINLQEKLIAAHQDLISCLKSKNSRSLETVH